MENNNVKELLATSVYFDNKAYIDVKTEDGVTTKSYTYTYTDNKGELVTKSITDIKTIETFTALDTLFAMSKLSVMGICIECGNLTIEQAKALGFKTVASCLASKFDLNTTTVNKYRRISKLFGKRTIDENGQIHYAWKNGIPVGTSVTNLDCIMGLANFPSEYEDLTEEEITEIYATFINNYIANGKLPLLLPNKDLRKVIKDLDNTLEAEAITEITKGKEAEAITEDKVTENKATENKATEDKATEDKATEDKATEESKKESATHSLNVLALIFKGNKDVEKALSVIAKAVSNME